MEEEYSTRKGPGISWRMVAKGGMEIINGFTIDDLDTKSLSEAQNNYEKAFVLIRATLEKNENRCMDDLDDRLHCCQEIVDTLKASGFIR